MSRVRHVGCALVLACFLHGGSAFSVAPVREMHFSRTLPIGRASPQLRVPTMGLFDFLQNKNPSTPPPTSPARGGVPPPFSGVAVPRSYDEIHAQAIAGVQAGFAGGVRKMEVEFPPIAQVNKLSDGSASSQRLVRRANVEFAVKAAQQLSGQARTLFLVSGDQEAMPLLSAQSLPANVKLGPIAAAAAAGAGDLILVLTPATTKQWAEAAACATRAPVAVLNGVFSNGYPQFDMAYYLKPMTFNTAICGYLVRQYPSAWTVFDAKTGGALDFPVKFVNAQGCIRPDLQAISNFLT